MVYPISCILPHGRTLYFDESVLKIYNEKPKILSARYADHSNVATFKCSCEVNEVTNQEIVEGLGILPHLTIDVYDRESCLHTLSLCDIGDFFHFTYVTHLVFIHESDLRNYHSWSLDSICVPPGTFDVDNVQKMSSDTGVLVDKGSIDLDKKLNIDDCDLEDKITKGGLHENLFIKHVSNDSNIEVGYGLYTSKCVSKGKMIGEYVGILLSNTQEPSAYSMYYPSSNGDREINATEYGNVIRFVNHSSNPNCSFVHVLQDGIMHIICVSFL
jgi:SET domain